MKQIITILVFFLSTVYAMNGKWTPVVMDDITLMISYKEQVTVIIPDKDEVDFTIAQRLMANKIISIFENGTPNLQYDYIEHIDDQHGYTAGIAGYTSATGDMLEVIEKYTQIKFNNVLRKSIYVLKDKDLL